MADRYSLPPIEFAFAQPLALAQVRGFLAGRPGIVLVTGVMGSGKVTNLLVLAKALSDAGVGVDVVDGPDASFTGRLDVPSGWTVSISGGGREEWREAVRASVDGPAGATVVGTADPGMLDVVVPELARGATAGKWGLLCLDTPYVGVDVLHLEGLGLDSGALIDATSAIVSMFLMAKLCAHCRREEDATQEEMSLIQPDATGPVKLWREGGCAECGGRGVRGRIGAFEAVTVDDTAREVLKKYVRDGDYSVLAWVRRASIIDSARRAVRDGTVGIGTYRREILRNPLLRGHVMLERESMKAERIRDLFGRFVTNQIAERVIADAARVMEGEKRRVTVMFADVRGFTGLSEGMAPHDLFVLLNRYFGEIIDIVFRNEGTIDKFVGDQIMVVFGAPVEQPDQEVRAVRCAIEIMHKVEELGRTGGAARLGMGIGINTGEAVAGCLGNEKRTDYTVLGDTVNVASRLEGRAAEGQILVGPATRAAIGNSFRCEPTAPLALKGRAEPITAHSVGWKQGRG